ncbi:MAG: class I SAM-dependent methyltransferase [Deltaproteobacteria bacterium]|nr:MAG: class I SAM-dependent methyltransferase [Deltaproteobacteria bacterium]
MNINKKTIDKIPGFLDEAEGAALYTYAVAASPLGPCLEIGSYCGKSAVYLGMACRKTGNVLFSIDHHRGSEEQQPGEFYFDPSLFNCQTFSVDTFPNFRKTLAMAGLEDTVVPIVCRSELAAKCWATPLGLVFIDGGHSLAAARTDYRGWHPHILPGGYLLVHDIFKDPARGGQAPYEIYRSALASGRFTELVMVGTLGVLQRVDDTGRKNTGSWDLRG